MQESRQVVEDVRGDAEHLGDDRKQAGETEHVVPGLAQPQNVKHWCSAAAS